MVCSENDTSINVTIPVVMIPQSAGKKLRDYLDHGTNGEFILKLSFCNKLQNFFIHFTML
jgi:hypothetical protein